MFIYKMRFLLSNNRLIRLALQLKCVKIHHDDVILTSALRSILADRYLWRIYRVLKMHLIVSTYRFVFSLTPLYDFELLILSFFKILLCC